MGRGTMIQKAFLCILYVLVAGILVSCTSAPGPVNTEYGIAIKGFDPVAYFTAGEPVKGDEQFSYEWNGATWLFAAKRHKELFMNNPERYAPQYGGY